MLDTLYNIDSTQEELAPLETEPVSNPMAETVPSVSLEQALARAADDGPADEPVQEDVQPEAEVEAEEKPKLTKEDLTSNDDLTDELQRDLTPVEREAAVSMDSVLEGELRQAMGGALDDLSPEDHESLALAKYAQLNHPDKYPKVATEMAAFLKKKRELQESRSDDYDFEFSPSNSEAAELIKEHEPKFTAKDRKFIERAQLKEEVLKETRQEMSAKEYERDLRDREPKIDKTVQKWFTQVAEDIFPEDIAKVVESEGIDKARERYSFEVPILEQSLQNASHYAKTFLNLSNGVERYDAENVIHQQINGFIQNQADIFLKEGGERTERDGRRFVARNDFNSLPADKQSKYWTFSDQEILDMVRLQLKHGSKQQMDELRTRLSAYGNGASPPSPSPEPAPPAPKARATKSSGATASVDIAKSPGHAVLEVLGL
jgi:hypothetical protein